MARIRSIKPEIASDAKLARLSRGTRYHFVLLWTVSDDAGYFRASPRQLLGQLYPHDSDMGEAKVNEMTAELADAGFVVITQTDDGPIGYVVNWSKHQKIDRPSRSHLRECVESSSRNTREAPSEGVLSPDLGVLTEKTSSADRRLADRLTSEAGRTALASVLATAEITTGITAAINAMLDGMHPPKVQPDVMDRALIDYVANGMSSGRFNARHFRSFALRAAEPQSVAGRRGGTGKRSYDNAVNALRDLPEAG